MTISSTTSKISYNGAGTTGPFAIPFKFLVNADIIATHVSSAGVETTLTLTTHYTLSGAGVASGGSLTLATALAVGEKLIIHRDPAITQEVDYVENAAFPAESHETALDKLTMICQSLGEKVGRAVLVDISDPTSPADLLTTLAADVAAAAAIATNLSGTSTTAVSLGTGPKTFTTQAGKAFDAGRWLLLSSAADPTKFLHGYVSSYSGTSLVVVVTNFGGTGTPADWTITISGTRGATGATGAAGAGTGDMLKADNLAGLASNAAARGNLGLGNSATFDVGTTAGTVASGADPRFAAAGCPVGSVIMMAGETVPTGYLECNGAAVSRTTYSDLFAAIGVRHGQGNGTTTFNLPYTPGLFPRGWDHGAGNDPDVATRTAAATGGVTGDHVGSLQGDELKAHTHTTDVQVAGAGGYTVALATSSVLTALPPRASGSTGGAETRGKNFMVMFCIKY